MILRRLAAISVILIGVSSALAQTARDTTTDAPTLGHLNSIEVARMTELLKAAEGNDWEKFKSLSDDGFINTNSMRKQFDAARIVVRYDDVDVLAQSYVAVDADGTRAINSNLPAIKSTYESVFFHLVSIKKYDVWKIQVIVFYPQR